MKRLVICCDGTWNTPDQKDGQTVAPSNVVKFARAVRARDDDDVHQIMYYNRGVGTRAGLDRWTGGAFGHGLAQNVQDAYRFIIDNYEEGDRIYLLGFSRGAYTARSVAGFIRNCGLLERRHRDRFPEAYELYRDTDIHPDDEASVAFRGAYSREVRIEFLGVWDTVGALGIPVRSLNWLTRHRYQFHDVRLSRIVKYACHAVAIDEKRSQFRPTLWETTETDVERVEQAWFAGVHANIGGGYRDAGLSDIALSWIADRAMRRRLSLDPAYFERHVEGNPFGELRESRRGLYQLWRPHYRPIGVSTTDKTVHPTALERHGNAACDYAPKNLVNWIEPMLGP